MGGGGGGHGASGLDLDLDTSDLLDFIKVHCAAPCCAALCPLHHTLAALAALCHHQPALPPLQQEMPDSAMAPGGGGAGRGSAGMFKSRSMGNLMDLSGTLWWLLCCGVLVVCAWVGGWAG